MDSKKISSIAFGICIGSSLGISLHSIPIGVSLGVLWAFVMKNAFMGKASDDEEES